MIEVVDQSRDGLIPGRQSSFQSAEEVRVVIPSTVVEGDEWHAGFDESSCQQGALAEAVSSVGIASRIGLGLDIERFLGFWCCDQFDSLLEELIDGHDRVGCCRIAEAGESIDKVA